MPQAARVGDIAVGTPHCHSVHPWSPVPHPVSGPIQTGAATVYIENSQAARLNDMGIHAACCGPNTYMIVSASGTCIIEGSAAARVGDTTLHCGTAAGSIVSGASTTMINS
jgi:uncharacterized Zn-binding protein involved in type VI secretion